MGAPLELPPLRRGSIPFLLWAILSLIALLFGSPALAKPLLDGQNNRALLGSQQIPLTDPSFLSPLRAQFPGDDPQKPIPGEPSPATGTFRWMLDAVNVMQSKYFVIWQAKWPTASDWTAAVMGTQVSATLSAISSTLDQILCDTSSGYSKPAAAGGCNDCGGDRDYAESRRLKERDHYENGEKQNEEKGDGDHEEHEGDLDRGGHEDQKDDGDGEHCDGYLTRPYEARAYENLIDYYFQQTTAFWYGENFFGIRLQAYDDMLWVVLEWLESIKFQKLHSDLHYSFPSSVSDAVPDLWHGSQFKVPAAHRSRVFYGLASKGWDTTLCGGGMIWSPWLTPYKNAITNELFVSASIGMYLYFPGDKIADPMLSTSSSDEWVSIPHNPDHLAAAVKAYKWLKNSNMTGQNGLYADGFHISGWSEKDPGTGKCDVLNTMLYTYNQGVVLSGLRGLWLATGSPAYLNDGHDLINKVLKSTGWPDTESSKWQGLGRGGVLEEACDSLGTCSQDGQTFKGIFFWHLAEFCRDLSPQEIRALDDFIFKAPPNRRRDFEKHLGKCATYRNWIRHNANSAYMTKNEKGQFGMWWGRKYPDPNLRPRETSTLPYGAVDYVNENSTEIYSTFLKKRPSQSDEDDIDFDDDFDIEEPILADPEVEGPPIRDVNDRGRGRTVETQAGALAVFRALYQWENSPFLSAGGSYN